MTAEELQKAFKYLFPDEIPFLKELAQSLPDDPVVVNIGAGAGTSGLAFVESRPDLTLFTIDIQSEESPFGCLVAEEKMIKEAGLWYFNFPFGNETETQHHGSINISRCYHHHGDSKEVGQVWKELFPHYEKVDMVFVDGDHSYEGCKGDIEIWIPNIKSGGIIAVHDYKKKELYAHDEDYKPYAPHPKPWPGVDKAVDELLVGKCEQILRVDSLIAFRIE